MDPSANTKNAFGYTPLQEMSRIHDSKTGMARGTFIALIPLTVIAVILRFTARKVSKAKLWWDDWLTVLALIFTLGLLTDLLLGTKHGLGVHAEFAGMSNLIYGGKVLLVAEITYQLAMCFIKLAILLFYFRLFGTNLKFLIAVWVMATVTVCWYITSTFVIIFQCDPVHALWDRLTPNASCIPQKQLWIGSSVTSLLTDAAILFLPMPMIWRLKVNRNQKVALSGLFLLGAFVCIASIVRLFTINDLSIYDMTWTDIPSAVWTSVECSVAVISACLPTMRPLFSRVLNIRHLYSFGGLSRGGFITGNSDKTVTSPSAQDRSIDPEKAEGEWYSPLTYKHKNSTSPLRGHDTLAAVVAPPPPVKESHHHFQGQSNQLAKQSHHYHQGHKVQSKPPAGGIMRESEISSVSLGLGIGEREKGYHASVRGG